MILPLAPCDFFFANTPKISIEGIVYKAVSNATGKLTNTEPYCYGIFMEEKKGRENGMVKRRVYEQATFLVRIGSVKSKWQHKTQCLVVSKRLNEVRSICGSVI